MGGTSSAGEIRGTAPDNNMPEMCAAARAAIASAGRDKAGCVDADVWGLQVADR